MSIGADRALPHNKVCELEDFAAPDLRAVIRDPFRHDLERFGDAFPAGVEDRECWELGMMVRAFGDHGIVRPDARILGVGAGAEVTIFYLTNLIDFVQFDQIANAAYEMGRVLKPGGLLTVSTALIPDGPLDERRSRRPGVGRPPTHGPPCAGIAERGDCGTLCRRPGLPILALDWRRAWPHSSWWPCTAGACAAATGTVRRAEDQQHSESGGLAGRRGARELARV